MLLTRIRLCEGSFTALNRTLHTRGEGTISDEEEAAWRRLDANGAIPFLQEGILLDEIQMNICDVFHGTVEDTCNSVLADTKYISVPFGNAAGPGLETECRRLPESKYCFNYLSAFKHPDQFETEMNVKLEHFLDTFSENQRVHNNRNIMKIMPLNISNVVSYELDSYSDHQQHHIETEERKRFNPETLIKLSKLNLIKSSYFKKFHSLMSVVFREAKLFQTEDVILIERIALGLYIHLWYSFNSRLGPALLIPQPYQGMCYPSSCTKQDIENNNVFFFNATIFHYLYDYNGNTVIAFSPKMPQNPLSQNPELEESLNTPGCSDDVKYSAHWKPENYVVVTLLGIIGFLVIAGTVADVQGRNDSEMRNSELSRKISVFSFDIDTVDGYLNVKAIYGEGASC